MFLKRHQTGIIQFNTKGWLKSLLYIETMAGEKKYWLFKTSVRETVMKVEGHVGKKRGKKKSLVALRWLGVEIHTWPPQAIRDSGGNRKIKYLLWLTVKTENVLCLQLCYLLPHSIHFETSEKVKNQIFHITNMYNIFWPVFLHFHYCTSILSHTLIYIAFQLPKSYLHIFGKTLINVNST